MGNRYRLVGLKNSELLAGLSALVQRSHEITAEELAHLAEIEDRMLHLELGFASLFAYCVAALGMSEGAAGRRVAAARVCRRFPEAFERVARGDLHLSALCALSPHLNAERASELFEVCRRKSRRQIEELLAARFPRADVREQIRRLPVRTQVPLAVSAAGPLPREVASAGTLEIGSNSDQGAVKTAQTGAAQIGSEIPRRREIEALAVDRFGIHFTADAELRELIERARALSSHRLPKGDLSSLMKLALKTFVEQQEKQRFAVGRKPRKVRGDLKSAGTPTTPPGGASEPLAGACLSVSGLSRDGTLSTPPGGDSARPGAPGARSLRLRKRSRTISAAVTREVYLRDQGQCSFVAADGRRCGARAFLQLDHVEPWAVLGQPVVKNIRILCRAHNLLHARNWFGAAHVAAKIAARRGEADDERTRSDES